MLHNYSKTQLWSLVIMRVVIGWHFAYEGVSKLLNSTWTAAMYLTDSKGIMAGSFNSMASNPSLMNFVDFLNEWGLLFVGLGLIVGAFSRIASIGGILLLVLYYLSHPALLGVNYAMPMEGSYLWVDKNVVEMAALFVTLLLPTSHIIGLDRFLKRYLSKII